ncbi:C1 family peptidase [Pseudomonas chlororaphis]
MYIPTLVEVPVRRELSDYRKTRVPVLDQGQENACTGYGLATVAHYLLRTRRYQSDATLVSPHMLYDLARRYDEWAGEVDEGSSCRGAMKGWYKHGVCPAPRWQANNQATTLTQVLAEEAALRPLGAYFRVNHTDIVAMHAAIAEVGVLYASASVHEGWHAVGGDGHIQPSANILGGHAFAIVAYDQDGFWIQNSWGETWGYEGFAHLRYDDWLANGADAWVARLGAPITLRVSLQAASQAKAVAAASSSETLREIRPHVISLGNDGAFDPRGDLATWRPPRPASRKYSPWTSRASPPAGRKNASWCMPTAAWWRRPGPSKPWPATARPCCRPSVIRWRSSGRPITGAPWATC